MMRMMNNKANVKIFSIVIAAIFIVGIGALAYTQMASPSSNSGTSTIGVIDTSRMLSQDNPIVLVPLLLLGLSIHLVCCLKIIQFISLQLKSI